MAPMNLPPIDTEEFLGMLREAVLAPDDLLDFVRIVRRGDSIDPLVEPVAEDAGFLRRYGNDLADLFNSYSRRHRERRYRQRMGAGHDGIRILSEGDSWFQYPFQLRDVIDHLSEDYAVLSLSLIHISEPTRPRLVSRMPSSA